MIMDICCVATPRTDRRLLKSEIMSNPWHVYIFFVDTKDLEGSMKIVGIDEQPLTFEAMAMVWVRETHWWSSAGKSEFP